MIPEEENVLADLTEEELNFIMGDDDNKNA